MLPYIAAAYMDPMGNDVTKNTNDGYHPVVAMEMDTPFEWSFVHGNIIHQ